jgi:Ca-activated chloride channel family protein
MIRRLAAPVAIAGVLAPAVPGGGAAAQQTRPAFRSGVDLVALNVAVTDDRDQPIGGLGSSDFAVFEDGVPQTIASFASERQPIDLGLLLDTSSSMSFMLDEVHRAATSFVEALHEGDRVTVIQVRERTEVLHPLSADRAAAISAILRTRAAGETALFTAIYVTAAGLEAARSPATPRRQAIAVLSDGRDTSSVVSADDAIAHARDAGVAVYTITLQPVVRRRAGAAAPAAPALSDALLAMRSLALETGGRSYVAPDAGALEGIYASIANELATQYLIGYVSTNTSRDGGFRAVSVSVPSLPEARARTRRGYRSQRDR